MAVIIVLTIVFTVLGFVFLFGKGGFLIAGYNTANEKEKEKYDIKKLNRCFSIFSFGIAITMGVCGYVDTEKFATYVGLPLIAVLLIFIMVASGTYCKKK